MEEQPVAAAPATEAPSTNSNQPAPAQEAAPTAAPATPAAPTADIPADQIEAFNKFVNANGGFEKAFAKLKTDVSTPSQQPVQPAQPVEPVTVRDTAPQFEEKIPDGFMSLSESVLEQYYDRLANRPEYAPIADKIRNGDVIKEMSKFGIQVTRNGAINRQQVKDFLDMYVKTIPAPEPAAPVTSTPTADYVQVGENITKKEDAYRILLQNAQLRNSGIAEHPQTQAAKEFIKNMYKK